MKLSALGEFGTIDRIKAICKGGGKDVLAGIGDDSAVVDFKGKKLLATADMLIEGVHFDRRFCTYGQLGYKSLAVNISDIAAMGGTPRYYMVSLAAGPDERVEDIEALYRGMEDAAARFGLAVIGGDTCASPGPMVISITALGEMREGGPVLRSGARPGDDIYVTGTLGDSLAGLEILKAGAGDKSCSCPIYGAHLKPPDKSGSYSRRRRPEGGPYLIKRHLEPEPRVSAGRMLARSGLASSMIDISDGFSSDLGHILEEGGVGARIRAEELPLSGELVRYAGPDRAAEYALTGGEDYELLFTAHPEFAKRITAAGKRLKIRITAVGKITEKPGAFIESG
ncbi:MAG: thiamine-phosphate kinase, partial [Nitrospirota bacterium]